MKQKYATVQDYDYKKQINETKKGIHSTIPDQAYSIKQILDKFVRGQPINNMVTYNNADYKKGEQINWQDELKQWLKPEPISMDLTERKEYAKQAKNEINELKNKYNDKNKHKENDKQNDNKNKNNENQGDKQENEPAK